MNTPADIEKKFWKALKSDRTVMLGVADADNSHTHPMTAQLDGDEGPIWFFGSKESALTNKLAVGGHKAAVMVFAAKDHDLFASVHGSLSVETDRAVFERLWSPFVAAWYTGKDDPKMLLMRLNPSEGQIWLDGSGVIAGIKMMLGVNPKENFKNKVAKVDLS
jgi:general stress protein 26